MANRTNQKTYLISVFSVYVRKYMHCTLQAVSRKQLLFFFFVNVLPGLSHCCGHMDVAVYFQCVLCCRIRSVVTLSHFFYLRMIVILLFCSHPLPEPLHQQIPFHSNSSVSSEKTWHLQSAPKSVQHKAVL